MFVVVLFCSESVLRIISFLIGIMSPDL